MNLTELILMLVLIVVVFFIGFAAGQGNPQVGYHRELCVERLAHAAAPRDSLTVYESDGFCLVPTQKEGT